MTPVVVFLHAGAHFGRLVLELGVEEAHQIRAVIHREVGMALEYGAHVGVVGVTILAVDRVTRNAVFLDQRGCDIILRRERIGCACGHVRAARLERAQQVAGFGGDVQAGAHLEAFERQVLGEALADFPQHRHLQVGPFDARRAAFGEAEIRDIIFAAGAPGFGHGFTLTGYYSHRILTPSVFSAPSREGPEVRLVLAVEPECASHRLSHMWCLPTGKDR